MLKSKKKKITPNNLFNSIPNISQYNITRYTLDAWIKTYPNGTVKEWEEVTNPNSFSLFLGLHKCELEEILMERTMILPETRVVTIDDEYFEWLKKEGLENTRENRMDYINHVVDDDNATRLMKKHGWDVEYFTLGIPLVVFHSKDNIPKYTRYMFQADVVKKLKEYLEKIFGQGNIFLSRYILNLEDYPENAERFQDIAKISFESGATVQLGKWEEQHVDEESGIQLLIIPFVFRHTFESAKNNLNIFFGDYKNSPSFGLDRDALDELGLEDVEDFGQVMGKDIEQTLSAPFVLLEGINYSSDAANLAQALKKSLIKEM